MSAALLEALAVSLQQKEPVALARVIRSPRREQVGARAIIWLDRPPQGSLGLGELEAQALADAVQTLAEGRHRLLRYLDQGIDIFVEVQQRPPRLLIVGAGHIAVPLCELGALCDFSVIVIDDRAQFANRSRFPRAADVIAADIRQTVSALAADPETYVVLVTRGHSLDVECLTTILDRPLAYIGMIGSRRRIRAVFDLLEREQGIAPTLLERVHAPIGLAIRAETPAEIAVSIMAEIIAVRRGGRQP
jgi:xanthine dehydrogenase accessory factor